MTKFNAASRTKIADTFAIFFDADTLQKVTTARSNGKDDEADNLLKNNKDLNSRLQEVEADTKNSFPEEKIPTMTDDNCVALLDKLAAKKPEESKGFPIWVIVVGLVVILAIVIVVLLLLCR